MPLIDRLAPAAARHIADALARGHLPQDKDFDRYLPKELRLLSERHWTPLKVASRVVRWWQMSHRIAPPSAAASTKETSS